MCVAGTILHVTTGALARLSSKPGTSYNRALTIKVHGRCSGALSTFNLERYIVTVKEGLRQRYKLFPINQRNLTHSSTSFAWIYSLKSLATSQVREVRYFCRLLSPFHFVPTLPAYYFGLKCVSTHHGLPVSSQLTISQDINVWLSGKMTTTSLKMAFPSLDPWFRVNKEPIHGATYGCPV